MYCNVMLLISCYTAVTTYRACTVSAETVTSKFRDLSQINEITIAKYA